jgi:oligopeptide/dipeptide ABC transporter ATP-binding protein
VSERRRRQRDDLHKTHGEYLLEVQGLSTEFIVHEGVVRAVDDVSFCVRSGEVVGLVGETGCGKSVTVNSVMRLILPPGRIVSGEVLLGGRDLMRLSEAKMRSVRGREIAMIFQKPMSSLNPVFTLGSQFVDVIRLHRAVSMEEARRIAIDSLDAVALGTPEELLARYPFELSGGQQQRAMIAMALSCGSRLLIADEPTTALDVSVQLQILKLIRQIMDDTNMSTLIISHDMGVIGCICNRIYVMYASRIVEHGPTAAIIEHPGHPYVVGLIGSIPAFVKSESRLEHIPGEVPNPLDPPPGCRFHPRCKYAITTCRKTRPPLRDVGPEHAAACLRTDEIPRIDEDERKLPC